MLAESCVRLQVPVISHVEGNVSIKRKWLKVLMLLMMASASFGSPMNPKEIEDLMHIMTRQGSSSQYPRKTIKGTETRKILTREILGQKALETYKLTGQFSVAEASHDMVVDYARGLH